MHKNSVVLLTAFICAACKGTRECMKSVLVAKSFTMKKSFHLSGNQKKLENRSFSSQWISHVQSRYLSNILWNLKDSINWYLGYITHRNSLPPPYQCVLSSHLYTFSRFSNQLTSHPYTNIFLFLLRGLWRKQRKWKENKEIEEHFPCIRHT